MEETKRTIKIQKIRNTTAKILNSNIFLLLGITFFSILGILTIINFANGGKIAGVTINGVNAWKGWLSGFITLFASSISITAVFLLIRKKIRIFIVLQLVGLVLLSINAIVIEAWMESIKTIILISSPIIMWLNMKKNKSSISNNSEETDEIKIKRFGTTKTIITICVTLLISALVGYALSHTDIYAKHGFLDKVGFAIVDSINTGIVFLAWILITNYYFEAYIIFILGNIPSIILYVSVGGQSAMIGMFIFFILLNSFSATYWATQFYELNGNTFKIKQSIKI